jgi:hypothetical protein
LRIIVFREPKLTSRGQSQHAVVDAVIELAQIALVLGVKAAVVLGSEPYDLFSYLFINLVQLKGGEIKLEMRRFYKTFQVSVLRGISQLEMLAPMPGRRARRSRMLEILRGSAKPADSR